MVNGYFLNRFDRAFSPGVSAWLTAVLFGVVHTPNWFLMAVGAGGRMVRHASLPAAPQSVFPGNRARHHRIPALRHRARFHQPPSECRAGDAAPPPRRFTLYNRPHDSSHCSRSCERGVRLPVSPRRPTGRRPGRRRGSRRTASHHRRAAPPECARSTAISRSIGTSAPAACSSRSRASTANFSTPGAWPPGSARTISGSTAAPKAQATWSRSSASGRRCCWCRVTNRSARRAAIRRSGGRWKIRSPSRCCGDSRSPPRATATCWWTPAISSCATVRAPPPLSARARTAWTGRAAPSTWIAPKRFRRIARSKSR